MRTSFESNEGSFVHEAVQDEQGKDQEFVNIPSSELTPEEQKTKEQLGKRVKAALANVYEHVHARMAVSRDDIETAVLEHFIGDLHMPGGPRNDLITVIERKKLYEQDEESFITACLEIPHVDLWLHSRALSLSTESSVRDIQAGMKKDGEDLQAIRNRIDAL